MLLSVIIVSYNVKYFLEQCLSSLYTGLEYIDAEVWIVDNASTDGTIDYLKPRFPAANFIANAANVGFGKANNQVLQKCRGTYVLFLNPDTLLPENCLSKCIAFMQANQQAGAMGIRMVDGSGTFLPESKRSFPSPVTSFYKLTGLSKFFPKSKTFSRYALGYLDQHQNHEVDVLSGAFLLGRSELITKLNGFDEAFFMYGEDIDLSYRIQQSGYKNYYFSESTIIHFKGESTKKGSLNYVKMFYTAMSVFVRKHHSGASASLFALFIHLAIWLRAGFSATAGIIRRKQNVRVKSEPLKTIIVGTPEEFLEVTRLFENAGLKVLVAGRIAVNDQTENSLGTMADLYSLITNGNVDEIVFCRGYLGYRSIIEMVENLPGGISIRFHSVGTNSIVGSDSKDSTGEFVAAFINDV